MINKISFQKTTAFVVLSSLVIAIALGIATWDINFWPTDAKVFYFDATVKIPHLEHLSQIHEGVDTEKIRWLHGKELFLLAVSFMQRLINDFETLRPFILVCIMTTCLSSILIYFISRKYWGDIPALVCWFAFTASVWPYIYVLFAKHQPQGLFFFLLAVFLLQCSGETKNRDRPHILNSKIWGLSLFFLSGMCMAAALFSSSASGVYFPYYVAAFVIILRGSYQGEENRAKTARGACLSGRQALINSLIIFLGGMTVFVYVNWPHIGHNIKGYLEYVDISGSYNHFFYNQAFLKQWFPNSDVASVRGGWVWVVKYFFVIMPVLFPLYLSSVVFLFVRCVQTTDRAFRRKSMGLIALSLSAPMMAEMIQVAQYGANYFPSFVGIIMLIGYCAYLVRQACLSGRQEGWIRTAGPVLKIAGMTLIWAVAGMHLAVNAYAFLTDVYPCRMATTFLSRKIEELNIEKLYTYKMHPHRNHFVLFLNPDVHRAMRFIPIEYLIQPQEGYIMVPPVTGNSLYITSISTYADFDDDVFLNELIKKGRLENYAVASFKTLANSRLWIHEEEILSYRNLILNHQFKDNDVKGRVWLLDGGKIYRHLNFNIPRKEYLDLDQQDIRNIGTKQRLYIYEGYTGRIVKPKFLKNILARLYKIGNPTDSLVVYVYKIDAKQVVWVPFGEHFASRPLSGETLERDKDEGWGVFDFDPPLRLNPGTYFFIIYRTGEPDDENFYRIYNSDLGML